MLVLLGLGGGGVETALKDASVKEDVGGRKSQVCVKCIGPGPSVSDIHKIWAAV